MPLYQHQRMLEIHAPAKINLALEVLYRRDDGYHQLQTVLQELAYGDLLLLEEIPSARLELNCDHPRVPPSEANLAFKAALLLQRRYAPRRGARLTLYKKIPVAAGLGGGSSNAAAVLKGLNELWQLDLSLAALQELAAELGSDVAFFLYGGTALGRGRGEIIEPLPPFPEAFVLLVTPRGDGLSTPLVYRSLSWDIIKSGEKTAKFAALLKRLAVLKEESDYWEKLLALMVNDLEKAAFKLLQGLYPLRQMLLEMGFKPLLSGSGPTFFVLGKDKGALLAAARDLEKKGYQVILTSTVS